ncbi:muscarinic acetylcholine receptor M1-like [Diadema setosum]|uniref:muscarinic acetylcholine receptor M1-like n=1 Tax=Diadema setosum TaxID=31175 RepID=UPI003B3A717D
MTNSTGIDAAAGLKLTGSFFVYATTSILTIFLNLLILMAFAVEKKLRTYNNYFIMNMTIADLMVGLVVMPIRSTLELFNKWIFGTLAGILFLGVQNSLLGVSVFGIVVISIDRYIATFYPIRHFQSKSKKKAVYVNILTWVIPFCVWMTITVLWDLLEPTDLLTPTKLPRPNYTLSQASNLLICFLRFVGPFPLILILCVRIYLQVRNSSRKRLLNIAKVARVKKIRRDSNVSGDSALGDDGRAFEIGDSAEISSLSKGSSRLIKTIGSDLKEDVGNVRIKIKHLYKSDVQSMKNISSDIGTENQGPRGPSQSRTIRSSHQHPGVDLSSENSKTLRTLAFAVIVFTITWLPNTMTIIFHAVAPDAYKAFNKHFNYSGLARWTSCWNSLINPVAYAMAQPAIRRTITAVFSLRRP